MFASVGDLFVFPMKYQQSNEKQKIFHHTNQCSDLWNKDNEERVENINSVFLFNDYQRSMRIDWRPRTEKNLSTRVTSDFFVHWFIVAWSSRPRWNPHCYVDGPEKISSKRCWLREERWIPWQVTSAQAMEVERRTCSAMISHRTSLTLLCVKDDLAKVDEPVDLLHLHLYLSRSFIMHLEILFLGYLRRTDPGQFSRFLCCCLSSD